MWVGQMTVSVNVTSLLRAMLFLGKRLNIMTRKLKMLHLAALTAATAIYLAAATDVLAQSARNCGPRENVVDRLAQNYGETRQSIGIGPNNAVIEVFASDDTGTWTITVTSANGQTCLVASGQSFEELAEALPAKGNDA
jgi:hypothetical protein